MSNMSNWIATDDQGDPGWPGTSYYRSFAGIRKTKRGYELYVLYARGNNQGYLQEHDRVERRYRAATIGDVMRVGIVEVRGDAEFDDRVTWELRAAIRNCCFEAEDAEDEA